MRSGLKWRSGEIFWRARLANTRNQSQLAASEERRVGVWVSGVDRGLGEARGGRSGRAYYRASSYH